jgi:hypothetical protein
MSSVPASAVLYDTLVNAIGGRRVKVAVFLTFQFDPSFFEQNILPVLFEQSFSHIDQIRLVQLEERLRSVEHLAVYYDRRGLKAESARLDYRRIGLLRPTGYFHPKNILLLIENHQADQYGDSLLLVTTSANLTEAGWWRNVEVAYVTELHAGDKCNFRSDLLKMISRLKQEDTIPEDHPALESIRMFLLNNVQESVFSRKQGRLLPHLYYGQTSLSEFLSSFIQTSAYNLEIISPYFDSASNSQTLLRIIECLQPKATRVFLPLASDGSAECLRGYFDQIQKMPQVRWGLLPESLTQTGRDAKLGMVTRDVHAKIYRFWNQAREILFVGSVNLTSAAHSNLNSGNFESGILIETEVIGRQGWWLQPLEENTPASFHETPFEETSQFEASCPVTFCFDWDSEALTYFWESSASSAPPQAEVLAQNILQFTITPVRVNDWVRLPVEAAQRLKGLLKSTSLVEVRVGEISFRALVREEAMAHKPALFTFLTTEEILHYWSLLSPEQREHFIAQKSLLDIERLVQHPAFTEPDGVSMFDRFAGIFHAFSSLETYVREALQSERETEAVYRLLGEKHDSLSALLDKVIEDDKADRVHRYVTLLCALQLLDRIEKDFPDFRAKYRKSFKTIRDQLKEIDAIEAGFSFETPEVRAAFFAWFRETFLKPAKLPNGSIA